MAQELNPNCNCPKTECPRHGDCMACVEAHKAVEGGKIPYCRSPGRACPGDLTASF